MPTSFTNRVCRECGAPFKAGHRTSLFCSPAHKQAFHSRRRDRGAELYDFAMVGDFKTVKELLVAYKQADKHKRGGRFSYQDTDMAVTRLPVTYGNSGDGR